LGWPPLFPGPSLFNPAMGRRLSGPAITSSACGRKESNLLNSLPFPARIAASPQAINHLPEGFLKGLKKELHFFSKSLLHPPATNFRQRLTDGV